MVAVALVVRAAAVVVAVPAAAAAAVSKAVAALRNFARNQALLPYNVTAAGQLPAAEEAT